MGVLDELRETAGFVSRVSRNDVCFLGTDMTVQGRSPTVIEQTALRPEAAGEFPGSLEIHYKIKFSRQHHAELPGLRTTENPVNVSRSLLEKLLLARAVRHQSARLRECSLVVDRRPLRHRAHTSTCCRY